MPEQAEFNAAIRDVRRGSKAADARFAKTPRWTIIRRVRFAYTIRDLLYGRKARPFGRDLRHSWARFLAFYTRSKMLTYEQVQTVAEGLADDLRCGRTELDRSVEYDLALRLALSRRLVGAARRNAVPRGWPYALSQRIDFRAARIAAWMKQNLLDGRCDRCGTPLPCGTHDIGRVVIDGRGGLLDVGP